MIAVVESVRGLTNMSMGIISAKFLHLHQWPKKRFCRQMHPIGSKSTSETTLIQAPCCCLSRLKNQIPQSLSKSLIQNTTYTQQVDLDIKNKRLFKKKKKKIQQTTFLTANASLNKNHNLTNYSIRKIEEEATMERNHHKHIELS